jgi:MoaA/NifB/PqqE/SkfB family radical SAM enzyme
MYTLREGQEFKAIRSQGYNYNFNKITGAFARWGATKEDDPCWSPFGPEILDLEISTGACKGRCKFCYKENGTPRQETKHMTLETFQDLLSRMPDTLTQIAFGITDVYANPDFFLIMEHAREQGVVPNYTTHGLDMDDEAAYHTARLCGAVAVSVVNKEKTYDAIKMLTDKGMEQVNIHFMLSAERIWDAIRLVDDIVLDKRLAKLNAVVFLQYKPKGGNTESYTCPSPAQFKELIAYCDEKGVRYGFDSCTAPMYLKVMENDPRIDRLEQYVEPCESGLFSSYVNVDGDFFACSFCEGESGWTEGISVFDYDKFVDLWDSTRLRDWRETLLDNERACPMYNLGDGQSERLYHL